MILYRVFPYVDGADLDDPGSPTYLHRPQGRNRLDNPKVFDTWYFGLTPEAAVGEVFGDLAEWSDEMFLLPALPDSWKSMGLYEIDEEAMPLLDLDDAQNLLVRGLRPTQVVARNRPATQSWGLRIYNEGVWAGVRWWSFQRPHWTIICLWVPVGDPCPAMALDVEHIDINHRYVTSAAHSLGKPIV